MTDETAATTELAAAGVAHRFSRFPRPRSVEESAERQGIATHQLIKTLLVRRGEGDYVFVLVPGDRQMDWTKLRRALGVKRASLPDAVEAEEACGYPPGAITPLGATSRWPVLADAGIEGEIAIGGGDFGTGIRLDASDLLRHVGAEVADITASR